MSNFRKFSELILEILFPHMYSFFLAGSFQFSFRRALPSALFVYRLPCYPRLSIFNWVSNLMDWFCIYSVCYFRDMLVNSFCALSFWALILVGFLLLHWEAAFTSVRFFLTATVSHGTLVLALCLVGMHSAAAFMWVLTKFSYSSFGVGVSDISWSALNLLPSVHIYLSLMSQLSRDLS